MIARLRAAWRRWFGRDGTDHAAHHELHDARARQRELLARAEALGVRVDVTTRRYRKEHQR